MSDPVRELKDELLAAAERQHEVEPVRVDRRRSPMHRGLNRVLPGLAALAIAAALALLVTAPWSEPPGLVEQAQAALTAPAGTIRHEKWQTTVSWAARGCTVTRGPSELWLDEKPPHAWRLLLRRDLPLVDPPVGVASPVCWAGVRSELGGTTDPVCTSKGCKPTLRFVPPNTLRVSPVSPGFTPDPANQLRDAIGAGRAHDEGKAKLHGRTVERIRFDPPPACPKLDPDCPRKPAYLFVDPATFYPVEFHSPEIDGARAVLRFLTYEYLPRTPANRALADIRAQHPDAAVQQWP